MANILIRSGFARVDDWQATLFLFEYEYKIPMLPFNVAAILFVMMELVVTPVLALGLATRYAAILLFIMTLVLNYTYQEMSENYYWLLLFGVLITYGGNKLSLDYFLRKKYQCCKKTCDFL